MYGGQLLYPSCKYNNIIAIQLVATNLQSNFNFLKLRP
jgi:hypothetical protein